MILCIVSSQKKKKEKKNTCKSMFYLIEKGIAITQIHSKKTFCDKAISMIQLSLIRSVNIFP